MDSKSIPQKASKSTKNFASYQSRLFEALNGRSSKLHPEPQIKRAKMDIDLFASFRGFIILGRCLGLIPCSGVFKHSFRDLKFSLLSFAGLTTLFCVVLLSLNTILSIIDAIGRQKRNAFDIAESLKNTMFGSWGLFMYAYFLLRGRLFLNIFRVWAACNLRLTYTHHDKTLKWTIILISVVMFSSAILENAVLHMEYFVQFDDINGHTAKYGEEKAKNASILQMYYWRAHLYWSQIIGNHPILPILAFINHKLVLYGGNYVDVLMALFARALYFKFDALYKSADEILLQSMQPLEKLQTHSATELDRQAWTQLANDHDSLCDILTAMNNFFSPVIFVSYTINIYFVCIQLLTTLSPEFTQHSIIHSIYSPWSFVHVIARIFLLSLFMARINEYAHKTRDIVMRCPVELYSGPIAKLDKRVNVGPKLGMTGLGCFTVTKPFMLSILNVVFTIEIVLLQGIQTGSSASADGQANCQNSVG